MAQFNTPVSIVVTSIQVYPSSTTKPFIVITGFEVNEDGSHGRLPVQAFIDVAIMTSSIHSGCTVTINEWDMNDKSVHARVLA
jgi:hypothetical protein